MYRSFVYGSAGMKEVLREWKQTIRKRLRVFQSIAFWTKSLQTLSWFFP